MRFVMAGISALLVALVITTCCQAETLGGALLMLLFWSPLLVIGYGSTYLVWTRQDGRDFDE